MIAYSVSGTGRLVSNQMLQMVTREEAKNETAYLFARYVNDECKHEQRGIASCT